MRRFNRTVTQRIGALDEHYLSRGRSLGEARVLWEIGNGGDGGDGSDGGCDVRVLRSRLDLDSGYLSRLLRSLEAAGLVTVGPSEHDRRVRTASLTAAGRAERAVLDERSDALARSLLEPLTESQRTRLVAAMADVERLLTAALVDFDIVDEAHPHARYCLGEYFAELDRRFEHGFDPGPSSAPGLDVVLVATLRGEPIGCGALRFHGGEPTEVKRMWVAPAARGLGLGRRLLAELEATAAARGRSTVLHLETNAALTEAIALYRSMGYREVPAFNDEPYGDHWFEKHLVR